MTVKKTTKPKPLTKAQQLERKVQNLEYAICQAYNDADELFALLQLLRTYIDSENYSKYTAKNAINGLFTVAIQNQTNMMDNAGLEY